MFQQDHIYHQLSECGTTLMKVLKPNQLYHLFSIIYKPLLFKKYKYLATFEIGKRHLLVLEINDDLFNNRPL